MYITLFLESFIVGDYLIDNRVVSFFLDEGICDNDFFDYMNGRVVYIPSGSDVFWYGCHPILRNNKLFDIRVVVPIIETKFDIVVNIHEFTHAIELYKELGTFYDDDTNNREERAHLMEKKYLEKQSLKVL